MKGANLDTLKHIANIQTITSSNKYLSLNTNGTNEKNSEQKHPYEESSINEIKMGGMPFGSNVNSSRDQIPQTIESARESTYEELRMCNDIIEKLKSECANLELTVVQQRTEIQSLQNRIKQSNYSERNNTSAAIMDKREADCLVNRMKEELRVSQGEQELARQHVKQSAQIITSLQEQLKQSKNRTAYIEETQRNQIVNSDFQELEQLRHENAAMTKRYAEMEARLVQKEQELEKSDIRSKELLTQAQEDAQECIKYFKGLAFSGQKVQMMSQRDEDSQSNATMQKSNRKASGGRLVATDFPVSLAPVKTSSAASGRKTRDQLPQRRSESFQIGGNKLGERISSHSRNENVAVRSRSRSGSRSNARTHTTSPVPELSAQLVRQNRFMIPKMPRVLNTFDNEGVTANSVTYATTDLNQPETEYVDDHNYHLIGVVAKLEVALTSIGQAYSEVVETKQGIFEYVARYKDVYCEQIQKFSVLAYDYLERIDTLSKREKRIESEVQTQQDKVDLLKQVVTQQTAHIKAQNALILQQRTQIGARDDFSDKQFKRKDKEREKLSKLLIDELPLLSGTLNQSTYTMQTLFKSKVEGSTELDEVKQLHDMTKTKIKILEEELEKALQKLQNRDETITTDRKKFNRLTGLVKDIWQQEIQQPQQSTTMSGGHANTLPTGNVTHTSHRGCTSDAQFDKDITIQTTNTLIDSVPMPISWIADISDHIKQLKEMNDFQMDEAFQMVNALHNGKPEQSQGGDPRMWTYQPGADMMTNTSEESGISVNPPQSPSERDDIEEESAENLQTSQQNEDGEYGETIDEERNSLQEASERFQEQKEMSFSNRSLQRLRKPKDGETTKHGNSKRQTWQNRPLSSSQTRKHNVRRHDNRNQSQNIPGLDSRAVVTQRANSQMNSQIKRRVLSGGRNSHVHNGRLSSGQRDLNAPYFVNQGTQNLYGRFPNTIDHLSQSNTINIDCYKRNELYAMLREEVMHVLRQSKVHRETIMNMKQDVKKHKQTIKDISKDYDQLAEDKEATIEQNRLMEQDLKEQEYQNEELQGVVEERDQAMDTHKTQIEDFEGELLSLQDQMTHIMKLNAEISAASEHWERAFNQLKEETASDNERVAADQTKAIDEKNERIQQYKKKLQDKENRHKELLVKYGDEVEQRKTREQVFTQMKTKETNTDPALELLEKHNQALETQLAAVKKDVGAVVDQYEAEQFKNRDIADQLDQHKDVNKSLVGELEEAQEEINNMRDQIESDQAEIRQISDAMEQDQEYYKEQMANAEGINEQLQVQVEQVTLLTEELQEQIQESNLNSQDLANNLDQQEKKVKQLEKTILNYQKKLSQSVATLDGLRSSTKQHATRDARSHSHLRMQDPARDHSHSDLISDVRGSINDRHQSSGPFSKNSSMPHAFNGMFGNKEHNENTIHTSTSIFDETNVYDESTIQQIEKTEHAKGDPYQSTANSMKMKPPRKQSKRGNSGKKSNARVSVSPKTPFQQSAQSSVYLGNNKFKRGSGKNESSVNIEISQADPHSRTHAGGLSIMGASAITACCCGSNHCNNTSQISRPQKESHGMLKPDRSCQMTEIDELDSYRQLKLKSDVDKFAKKKVRKVIKMIDVLLKNQVKEAKDLAKKRLNGKNQSLHSSAKRSQSTSQERSVMQQSSMKILNWSQDVSLDYVTSSESAILEAKAYFNKRQPTILACLRTLAENFNPSYLSAQTQASTRPDVMQNIDLSKKDPPTIVSGRMGAQTKDEYVETEVSDTAGSRLERRRPSMSERTNQASLRHQHNMSPNVLIHGHAPGMFNGGNTDGQSSLPPDSACRHCTATFHQTMNTQSDLTAHCRQLFQKFVQAGRSLAGICYGGCLFMGSLASDQHRKNIDFALQFLARDTTELEATSGQNLDELNAVIDNMLACLSSIISNSCQTMLQVKSMDSKQQKQHFDSIMQKSHDLSIDQNHVMTGFDTQSIKTDMFSKGDNMQNTVHAQSIQASQTKEKLLEVENRIKQKFQHISTLESSIDSIINRQKKEISGEVNVVSQLTFDARTLNKIFLNIRRAVSKLKIEIHQDYLMVGQINVQMQSFREASYINTSQYNSHMPNHGKTNSLLDNPLIVGSQTCSISGSQGISTPSLVNNQPIGVYGPSTGRESAGSAFSNVMSANQVSQVQRTQSNNRGINIPIHSLVQQSQSANQTHFHQENSDSIGHWNSGSIGTAATAAINVPQNVTSDRESSNSAYTHTATHTARNPKSAHIDKIVEELQGLTFEYSDGAQPQTFGN